MTDDDLNKVALAAVEVLAAKHMALKADHDALSARLAEVEQEREERRQRAYRQARIFEPSSDGYIAALAVYEAGFGEALTDSSPPAVVPACPQWQPIETAPKMRTIMLFAVTDVAEDGTVKNWKMASGSWHTGYDDQRSRAHGLTPWEWDGHRVRVYELHPTH